MDECLHGGHEHDEASFVDCRCELILYSDMCVLYVPPKDSLLSTSHLQDPLLPQT